VGSILEAENERGIAHVIEHLAFRGSKSSEANFQLIKEVRSTLK
jgi:predicted Zn-dependent peptidase